MKKLALAAAISLAASSSFAGGLATPIVEAPVVEARTPSTAGILIPLLLLVVLAVAVAR